MSIHLVFELQTRLVLDNGKKDENGEEKLSTEFYNYGKEEIKRINKKHGHGGHKKKEKEDDLAEIFDGLRDRF